jgi:hypothetical protein
MLYQEQPAKDFFGDGGAWVVARFTDLGAKIGLVTVELRNHEGQVQQFAPADMYASELPTSELQVLRYGDEETVLRTISASSETDPSQLRDRKTGNTDLHLVCSNPRVTMEMLRAANERRIRLHGGKMPVLDMQNLAGLTPVQHLCANLRITPQLIHYLLYEACESPHAAARGGRRRLDSEQNSSDAAVSPSGGKVEKAPRSAATALHIYTRGLPVNADVLWELIQVAPECGALSDTGEHPDDVDLSHDYIQKQMFSGKGNRPLHNITRWPHVRISSSHCVERLFDCCNAAANSWIDGDKQSTPLHTLCRTLTAMRVELRLYTTRKQCTVFIQNIPAEFASLELEDQEVADLIRSKLSALSKENDCIAFIRVQTGTDIDTAKPLRWAVVRFKTVGPAQKAIICGLETKMVKDKNSDKDGVASIVPFDQNIDITFADRMALEDIYQSFAKEAIYQDAVELGIRMLHQWRGQWYQRDVNILVQAGILEVLEQWIGKLWQPAPPWMPAGRYVSVDHDVMGMIVHDARPTKNFVAVQTGFVRQASMERADRNKAKKLQRLRDKLQDIQSDGSTLTLAELRKKAVDSSLKTDDVRGARDAIVAKSREDVIELLCKQKEEEVFQKQPYTTVDTSADTVKVCRFGEFLCVQIM